MLNAYGMAAFSKMPLPKVWEDLNKPLKTGAKYGTELCSAEDERRGVGINRFLQVFVEYLKYQKSDCMKKQNEFILKEDIYKQVYLEIDLLFDAAVYCLAGKKQFVKKGASNLRSGVSLDPVTQKSQEDLKKAACTLYKWMVAKQSRLRMLMTWQGAGGLAYVCSTHLFGMQCFLHLGNVYHNASHKNVSAEEWEKAILKRHDMELKGHAYLQQDQEHADDFSTGRTDGSLYGVPKTVASLNETQGWST